MSVGYFLRVGDRTTCGGKILTGDPTFQWYGVSAAREGDMVNCGKHLGTYKILGGVADTFDGGQSLAGSLDSFSSCPCHAKFIPGISDSYSKEVAVGLEKAISAVKGA
ncbi:MAG: PAAR domain-containing protein [Pantoea sp.]|uniref:PAAR domain-containing protein n=1 Tax=Pantoea sp. TaxID=69393 RepID=UPI00290F231B|nr:PAAR domain-containing protein [Pantoea sp.]MDU7840758.1 PAAR domain-containing protein [Pantoea sp.]